jgi:hypothetical protein
LVAAAACAVDFVFGAGLFAGAVESGLFAAGAGGFFCADAAAGAAAAGYGDGGGGGGGHCWLEGGLVWVEGWRVGE